MPALQDSELEVKRIEDVLNVGYRKRYIRKLRITGSLPLSAWDKDGNEIAYLEPEVQALNHHKSDEDSFAEFTNGHEKPNLLRPTSRKQELRHQTASTPIAAFMFGLHLTDLIWESQDQLPPCVLAALHDIKPRCRLHLQTFSLRSLIYNIREPLTFDEHERTLATSPYLHSVMHLGSKIDSYGRIDYNFEAILQMASGFAPNLKNVRTSMVRGKESGASRRVQQAGRPPWHGFHERLTGNNAAPQKGSKGRLHSLHLTQSFGVVLQRIQSWEQSVDFSCLSKLRLTIGDETGILHWLQQLAKDGVFAWLRDLTLGVFSYSHQTDEKKEEMDSDVVALVASLGPLEVLRFCGKIGEVALHAAKQKYGGALQYR